MLDQFGNKCMIEFVGKGQIISSKSGIIVRPEPATAYCQTFVGSIVVGDVKPKPPQPPTVVKLFFKDLFDAAKFWLTLERIISLFRVSPQDVDIKHERSP